MPTTPFLFTKVVDAAVKPVAINHIGSDYRPGGMITLLSDHAALLARLHNTRVEVHPGDPHWLGAPILTASPDGTVELGDGFEAMRERR